MDVTYHDTNSINCLQTAHKCNTKDLTTLDMRNTLLNNSNTFLDSPHHLSWIVVSCLDLDYIRLAPFLAELAFLKLIKKNIKGGDITMVTL